MHKFPRSVNVGRVIVGGIMMGAGLGVKLILQSGNRLRRCRKLVDVRLKA